MLNECLVYLKERIQPIMGERVPIFTRMADLKNYTASRVASTIPDGDVSTYSGMNSMNLDTKKMDTCVFDRRITVEVVLGADKVEELEPLYEAFLASLGEGLRVNGHYVAIELGEAGWADDKDSTIRAKIAVELPVTFVGGVYRPQSRGVINKITIEGANMQ